MPLLVLQNDELEIEIAPAVGGRIVALRDRRTGRNRLWTNAQVPLRAEAPGTPYDPNFYGGIDELLPNDIPETLAGVECPDHGELWTLALEVEDADANQIALSGILPRAQIRYQKSIRLEGATVVSEATLTNLDSRSIPLMWKLHVAVPVVPGDLIEAPAARFTAADPDWSRRTGSGQWEGEIVPDFEPGTTEFLYLFELREGWMRWRTTGFALTVEFDLAVFPYAWYFASYRGWEGHEVGILEPCTTMPISVNEAHSRGQTRVLGPYESLSTTYRYRIDHED